MRIGILHNAYRYRGGEDQVVDTEADLLKNNGHHVSKMILDSREVFATLGKTMLAMPAMGTGWNTSIVDRLIEWVRNERLDLVHCHNIYPIITPAALLMLHANRIPIVMTLHNFRPICANGLLTRDGQPCNECVTHGSVSAFKHSCYRGSRAQSAAWAIGRKRTEHHQVWQQAVCQFITPSSHVRDTFAAAGFSPSKITVRSHTVPARRSPAPVAYGALCVGRLDPSKGAYELAQHWPDDAETLTFIGTGPDESRIRELGRDNICTLGWLSSQEVAEHMSQCRALIQPSRLNETFGLTVAEAAAVARPSVAFNKGGPASIIDHSQTGCLVDTESMSALCDAAAGMLNRPSWCAELGQNAFEKYTKNYSEDAGLRSLLEIYKSVLTPSSRASA